MSDRQPVKIVVMGVSGAGKSTVGRLIAERFGAVFIDGDDLHAPEAVEKMRSGVPLVDDDRWPWLDRVAARLAAAGTDGGAGVVIACSALRKVYRDRIRAGAGAGLIFVHLSGGRDTIAGRQAARQGHYMPAGLMDSQFRTLEEPVGEPDVVAVDIGPGPEAIAAAAVARLAERTA
jgi:gluconokinase